ncbi:MAG: PqqD family protein [Candidatus Bathyarchaeia archaeon]
MPLFRKKPKVPTITKDQFLKLVPVRNPIVKWDRYPTGEVFLLVPRPRSKRSLFSKVVNVPAEKKVLFDKVGSHVWQLCDGKRTVNDIVNEMVATYKLARKEAEAPLSAHLQNLAKRGYIAFMPREVQSQGD